MAHTPSLHFKHLTLALMAAGMLAACGGGDDNGSITPPAPPAVSGIKVLGDSLSDSGTFGYKFTVQGLDEKGLPVKVWTEVIASNYGQSLCPHYNATSATTFAANAACHNYAIGGARINPLTAQGLPDTSPKSVITQMEAAHAQGFAANDLVLLGAGSNDAADLMEAGIAALQGSTTEFLMLVGSKVSAEQLGEIFASNPPEQALLHAGSVYMEKLASTLAQNVQSKILAQADTRVGILNVPPLTKTPLFLGVLRQISAAVGTENAQKMEAMFETWIRVFNAALSEAVANESRVALVDFYSAFADQVASPAKYGYSNVTLPACGLAQVPDARLDLCTNTVLSSTIPATETSSNWWHGYMFSNSFHPTPLGHAQMAKFTQTALDGKGWK